MVENRRMSSDRQFGNQGKLGFVPTSKEIVEKELSLIDFSELELNDFPVNICDLSGGTGDQLNWMNQYLLNQNIESNAFYNELNQIRFDEGKKNYPYFNSLNSDLFSLKIGSKVNKGLNKKVFSVIRNNPPYYYIELRRETVRAEVEFFLKNSLYDFEGAIHILEVPIHQLLGIPKFISMICYRYDMFVAKFPAGEFEKYKQVACILKKKKEASHDREVIDRHIYNLQEGNIPFLDEVNEKVFKVSKNDFKKALEIDIFRDSKVTDETLSNGLYDVLDNLVSSEKKSNRILKNKDTLKPIIELTPGHLSQLLSSGRYNGIMGDLLIRGGSNKVIDTSTSDEDNKVITTHTEMLKPFIELTNANGDIIYRDF